MAASSGEEDDECSKSKMEEDFEDINDLTSTGEFSVTNPFESHQTIDSLLQPSFSPSVFSVNSPSDAKTQKCTSSFWSIDQIAVLNPAEIDVSALHTQQNFVRLDPASEVRAQQAIDEFFASRIEMPSPWSSERSNNHYLALISPSPAQMKKKATVATPLTSKNAPFSSSSSISSSSHVRVRKLALSNIKNHGEYGSKMRDDDLGKKVKTESKNVSTQTTLTLPKDFDLEAILAKYHTFGKPKENANDIVGNTSLRRKLFFPDGREVDTRNKHGEINLNALQHIDDMDDIDSFIDSPVSLKKITPKNNNLTPLNHYGGHNNRSRTSSTCHSHYSSSPVQSAGTFDARTPSSGEILKHNCGSGVRPRRRMLGSSGDEEKDKGSTCLSTPEVSPVKRDDFLVANSNSKPCDLPAVEPIDESMSFQVGSDDYKTAPESSDIIGPINENMESSRRDLGIEIPPFSPIQPIKLKTNFIKASSNQNVESTQQSLTVAISLNDLCESPMLSPIQGKLEVNQTSGEEMTKVSPLLSSTATKPMSKFKCSPHILTTSEVCENRPFQKYEKVQYSCENKENIHPNVATYSSIISTNDGEEDVSMTSHHTSVCQETTFNEDAIQCDSFIEARNPMVLQYNQGCTKQIDGNTSSSKRLFHQLTEGAVTSHHTPLSNARSPKRPSSGMDFVVSKCYNWVEKVPNSETQVTGNQDSGYATTQSNHQQI